MIWRVALLASLMVLLVAACGGAAGVAQDGAPSEPQAGDVGDMPTVTVYKPPT